jgi:hypothetical protein
VGLVRSSSIDAVFARQSGLATIEQLLATGVTREIIRSRLTRRVWRMVLPRVVSDDARPLDTNRRLIAAQLLAGPDAMIASTTAAVWHGHGIALVAVTPRQIAIDPDGVLARIERAYEHARRRPRPDVVAVPIASAP